MTGFSFSPYGRTFIASTQTAIFRGLSCLRSAHLMACMALRAFSFLHFFTLRVIHVSGQVPPLNYFKTLMYKSRPTRRRTCTAI